MGREFHVGVLGVKMGIITLLPSVFYLEDNAQFGGGSIKHNLKTVCASINKFIEAKAALTDSEGTGVAAPSRGCPKGPVWPKQMSQDRLCFQGSGSGTTTPTGFFLPWMQAMKENTACFSQGERLNPISQPSPSPH